MISAALTLLALLLPIDGPSAPEPESVTKTGKVVPLADALKGRKIAADAETIAKDVVLVETDGTVWPILPDEASRALFLDSRLRDRKAEVSARKFPGLPYLQVVALKVEEGGAMRTPEYYCDVCTISVRYPQVCPCCQGPMELRMKPEIR